MELVKLQEWVKYKGLKVCIVFEGRDTAGKGGAIKAITERVSPRVFRVVALPVPTEREKTQMYAQRYVSHFPAAGEEVVIFDRSSAQSCRRRAGPAFCTEEQTKRFLEVTPYFESLTIARNTSSSTGWKSVSRSRRAGWRPASMTDEGVEAVAD